MASSLFETQTAREGEEATVVVRLHVQPGAGRQAVTGRYGDSLAVKVAPPPQDGRANAAVVALVAELLDAPADRVELASGERSRDKRVRVRGVDPAEVTRLLDQAVHRAGERPGGGSGGGRRR